jgi:hypothetical protein
MMQNETQVIESDGSFPDMDSSEEFYDTLSFPTYHNKSHESLLSET